MCCAGKHCCRGSRWKTSTINFENNLLERYAAKLREVQTDTRKFKGFQSFDVVEHGKLRHIDALPIDERALQKCLCENFLTNAYSHTFIYDNAASLRNKGMDFALNRLKHHLRHHYRLYGTKGGVLLLDFKNYFASLPHSGIKQRIKKVVKDEKLRALLFSLVDDFKRMGQNNGSPIGVGLGSEISQIIALDYISPIDHYIKDKCGFKAYGRYMDDAYVVSEDISKLNELLTNLKQLAQGLGVQLSNTKSYVVPLRHHGFHFLKMRIKLCDSGKVLFKINKRCIKTMRRKIQTFSNWIRNKKFNTKSAIQAYQAWRSHVLRCTALQTLNRMDKFFRKIICRQS